MCLLSVVLLGVTSAHAQKNDSIEVVLPSLDYNNPKKYVIEDVIVTGVKYLSPEIIIGTTGLVKGDSLYLPSDYITNILTQLWSQRYYSNVRALVETEGDKAFIEIVLKERPRVSQWKFEGVKKTEHKELLEKLNLRERIELSDFAISNSSDIIREYFDDEGFRNAKIVVKQRPDSTLDNFVIVTFDIDKGLKVKIAEITIEGNSQLDEKSLKKAMKETKEKTLINLLKSAKLNVKNFADDKVLVEDYLHSKGFRDGRVLSDSIYEISENRIGIKLKIEEGDKYHYRNINWVGNVKHSNEVLDQLLGIKLGDVYDRKTMDAQLGRGSEGAMAAMEGQTNISTIYQNDGHLTFQIEPVEKVVPGDSIDIDVKIVEGKQFTINNLGIVGNTRTNDRVIRREIYVRPGEIYDQSMLYYSMRQLGNMGHFNPENISPDIQPVSDQLVDISFNLEETQSDQLEVSGGWGGGMFVASVAVMFNNISMRKLFKKGAWRPYPSGDNQKLRISAQSNGTYYQAASVSFVEPWLGGKKPTSLSASLYYSAESDPYTSGYFGTNTSGNSSNARFMTVGASLGLSKRLTWPDPNFNLMGELSYQAYNLRDWSNFLMKDGVSNTIALAVTLMRNSTDQQIYPRSGSEMFVKATITPPWSLMDNKDYSNADMSDQERYRWIEYYKINSMGRFFVPMLPNRKLVFMAKAEFGYIGAYNENKPSPFEGFTVGGDGVSGYNLYGVENIGLRGYANGALTPYANSGQQARAYVKYTAELRYPMVLSPSSSVYGAIFAEGGNAFYDFKSFNPFNVKKSLGAGVRLFLPIVGMFGIDWGYGFDSVPGGAGISGSQFHFSIGQTF